MDLRMEFWETKHEEPYALHKHTMIPRPLLRAKWGRKPRNGESASLQAAKATNLSSPDRARGRRAGCQGNRVSLVKMRGCCWSADERWENVQPEDVEGGHYSLLYLFLKFKRWVRVIKIETFSSRAYIIRVHDQMNDLPRVFLFPPVPLWSP